MYVETVEVAQQLLEEQPDAVLLAPIFMKESGQFMKRLEKAEIPYIIINNEIEEQHINITISLFQPYKYFYNDFTH